jgi:hypothetical protein
LAAAAAGEIPTEEMISRTRVLQSKDRRQSQFTIAYRRCF